MAAYGGLKCIYFNKIKRDWCAAEGRLACHPLRILTVKGAVWPTWEPGFPDDCSALSFSPIDQWSWASQEGRATILSPPFPAAELHSRLHRAVHLHVHFLSAQTLSVRLPAQASWLSFVVWKRQKSAFNAEIGYGILLSFFFLVSELSPEEAATCPKQLLGWAPFCALSRPDPAGFGSAAGAEGPLVTLGWGSLGRTCRDRGCTQSLPQGDLCGTCAGVYLRIPFQSSQDVNFQKGGPPCIFMSVILGFKLFMHEKWL